MKTTTLYGFRDSNTSGDPAWFSSADAALRFATACGWENAKVETTDAADPSDIMDTPENPWALETPTIPLLRPGAHIRVKSPSSAFHDARGTVSHQVNASHLWAVRLEGFLGTVDFTANEMTVLK